MDTLSINHHYHYRYHYYYLPVLKYLSLYMPESLGYSQFITNGEVYNSDVLALKDLLPSVWTPRVFPFVTGTFSNFFFVHLKLVLSEKSNEKAEVGEQHWRIFTWIEEKLPAQPLFTMLAAFRVVIVVVSGLKSLDNVNGKGKILKKKKMFFWHERPFQCVKVE